MSHYDKMNIGNVNDGKYDIIKELIIIIVGFDDDKVGVNVLKHLHSHV